MQTQKNENRAQAKNEQPKVFTFNSNNAPIRVQVINNEPYFVAKDVCTALNISWSGRTLDQLPEDWKGVIKLITPGGVQEFTAITEGGMYKLAFRCQRSEIADKFTNWVAAEVLPTLRRTGRYEFAPRAAHAPYSTLATRRRNELFNLETMRLLWLIDSNLMQGDKKDIALLCGTSQNTITRVLTGTQRNARVLFALYERALENSASRMRASLYVDPESAIRDLSKGLPAKINDRMELVKDSIVMGRGSVPASAAIDFTANMQRGGAR